tara:strand:+ start:3313 stop:4230 length:918 start_codon:yes stop_codon:yes gene_type:complete
MDNAKKHKIAAARSILLGRGLKWTESGNGSHWVFHDIPNLQDHRIDYWPTTSKARWDGVTHQCVTPRNIAQQIEKARDRNRPRVSAVQRFLNESIAEKSRHMALEDAWTTNPYGPTRLEVAAAESRHYRAATNVAFKPKEPTKAEVAAEIFRSFGVECEHHYRVETARHMLLCGAYRGNTISYEIDTGRIRISDGIHAGVAYQLKSNLPQHETAAQWIKSLMTSPRVYRAADWEHKRGVATCRSPIRGEANIENLEKEYAMKDQAKACAMRRARTSRWLISRSMIVLSGAIVICVGCGLHVWLAN